MKTIVRMATVVLAAFAFGVGISTSLSHTQAPAIPAAQASATGWQTTNCPVPPGYQTGGADACDVMGGSADGNHGVDLYTSQNSTKALCMYDYKGNPGLCLATLGGAVQTFGRTIAGNVDGDSLDSYGNSNAFVPTNRILADGGVVTSGSVILCPPGHLVDMTGCVTLTLQDIQKLHRKGL